MINATDLKKNMEVINWNLKWTTCKVLLFCSAITWMDPSREPGIS